MQNKGIIKLFAILFGLVSIYQLSFTFIANSVEDDAEAFAAQRISSDVEDYHALREIEQTRYLDSIGNNEIISGITYNTAKDKELNKGLDLKGGINVILQISVKDILRELANNSKDPAFIKVLAGAFDLKKTFLYFYLYLFFEDF